MKKLFIFLLTLVLLFVPLNVCALENRFETAHDFYCYFTAHHKFPDYVCGVYSENGGLKHLTIMVLEGEEGQKGKEEILYWIKDDSTVSFSYGKYSYNYLSSIQDEVVKCFGTDTGFVAAAVSDNRNLVEVGVLKERKDSEKTNELISELTEKYGDAICFFYTDLIYTYDDIGGANNTFDTITVSENTFFSLWLFVGVLLVLLVVVVALWLVTVSHRKKLLVTVQGHTKDLSNKFSNKKIEAMVQNTQEDVPLELEERILNKIDNKN